MMAQDPEKRVPELRRPMRDGLACIVYRDEADIERTRGQEKFAERIIADEQTAFRKVTRGIAREFILIPRERHRAQ
jgi:hypothetical protein